ncbi:MAG: putative holin [Mycobacterium sp.]
MLVGCAAGLVAAVVTTVLVKASIRPDLVVALVVGVPGAVGMLAILLNVAESPRPGCVHPGHGPSWPAELVLIQVVSGG